MGFLMVANSNNFYVLLIVLLILLFIFGIISIFLFSKVEKMKEKQKVLSKIIEDESIENLLYKALRQQEEIAFEVAAIKNDVENIKEKQKRSFDKLGILRYNVSSEDVDNLSFSVGLSNEMKDALVVTGLHSEEGDKIFVKHVSEGSSDIDLCDEEIKVLNRKN